MRKIDGGHPRDLIPTAICILNPSFADKAAENYFHQCTLSNTAEAGRTAILKEDSQILSSATKQRRWLPQTSGKPQHAQVRTAISSDPRG
jgi:hypothetical protein